MIRVQLFAFALAQPRRNGFGAHHNHSINIIFLGFRLATLLRRKCICTTFYTHSDTGGERVENLFPNTRSSRRRLAQFPNFPWNTFRVWRWIAPTAPSSHYKLDFSEANTNINVSNSNLPWLPTLDPACFTRMMISNVSTRLKSKVRCVRLSLQGERDPRSSFAP